MSALMDKLKTAAEQAKGCKMRHVESVPVVETFRGQVIWEGVVEVFEVPANPVEKIYAWAVEGEKEPQYVTVKYGPPVMNALTAVRVWLVAQSKK